MLLYQIKRKVRLHPAQMAFTGADAFARGFVGGRGAGKTWVGAYDLIMRASPRRTYLAASPTSIMMGDITLPTFRDLARRMGVWAGVKLTPYPNVILNNGAVVRFRTAEDPEKLRGPNLSGAWLDEASLMDEDAYLVTIASLRERGRQGWLSATFTPKGLTHWTYSVFGQHKPDTSIFHARTADNPFNPPEFAETLAKQYDDLLAAQELEGRFLDVANAEWPPGYFGPSLWFDTWPTDLLCRVWMLDPSKGRQDKAGDYSAYVHAGIDRDGVIWLDADLARRSPERIVEDGLDHQRRLPADGFGIEGNAFQDLFGIIFRRRAQERNMHLPLYLIHNHSVPKGVRIRRLGPLFAQGKLRVKAGSAGGKLLVQQLREFPHADHDDGPDAAEMAVRLINYLLRRPAQADAREVIRLG